MEPIKKVTSLDEYCEVLRLFDEDPQKLVDDQTRFEFDEVEGEVILIDGVAAGEAWSIFEFVSGPFVGRKIAAMNTYDDEGKDEAEFNYVGHCTSDGMTFNVDPARAADVEDWGGGYYPEWDGMLFSVGGGEAAEHDFMKAIEENEVEEEENN